MQKEQTGHDSVVSVRHAIEYAHYIDGDRRIPSSICVRIGSTFDADPTQIIFEAQAPSPKPEQDAKNEAHGSVEDDSLEALLHTIQQPKRAAGKPFMVSNTDRSLQSSVLNPIADHPDLVHYYLTQCQTQSTKRPAPEDVSSSPRRLRLSSPSDLVEVNDVTERSTFACATSGQTYQFIARPHR